VFPTPSCALEIRGEHSLGKGKGGATPLKKRRRGKSEKRMMEGEGLP